MPALSKSEEDRQLRVWEYHYAAAQQLLEPPTEKPILSLYVSTIDRIIRVDDRILQRGVGLAAKHDGRSEDSVLSDIKTLVEMGNAHERRASTATQILGALIARMISPSQASGRVRIEADAVEVLDFLDEWFRNQSPDSQREQPGGAPAIIAQVLTKLGEPDVALWTPYHSQNQAKVFDKEVKFLVVDDQGSYATEPIRQVGRTHDPEVRNYSLEFAKGSFALGHPQGTTQTIESSVSDRLIAISPGYRFFTPTSGAVVANDSPADIAHLLSTSPQRGPSFAKQVAEHYKYWILGGLHKVSDPELQRELESSLQQVPSDVTVHVEVAGPGIHPWFQDVVRRYVDSIGVNVTDLQKLVETMVRNQPNVSTPPQCTFPDENLQREYCLRLAFWLACELDLARVYAHGLELDFLVRRNDPRFGSVSGDEMHREAQADLWAKIAVTNRARGAKPSAPPSEAYGLQRKHIRWLAAVINLRAYPLQQGGEWITAEGKYAAEDIWDRGWFDDRFEHNEQSIPFRAAVVPVAQFRSEPADLTFVGAGDTSSAVSFVFGCFASQGNKRSP